MIPLLTPLAGVIAGILLSPFLDPYYVWLCLPLSLLLAYARRWTWILAFALIAAGVRSLEPEVPPDPGDVAVRVIGRLRKPPEWRGLGIYLDLELQSVDTRTYRGRARLTEFLDDPALRAMFDALQLGSGDRLEILVKLHRPVVYRNPGVFDIRRYLERQQIYWTGTIRSPRLILVLDRGWHEPDRIKNWISRRLETAFAGDTNAQGLILGMVLGRKYGLSAISERQFQAGGLYHLVVVSGFNLAVIAGLAFAVVRHLPCKRRTRLLLVLFAALGYAALVEGQAPVARATLMVFFVIVGKMLDRGYAVGNSIAGTALLILLAEPGSLEDSSFQMTFAAVIAVIGIGMPAVKWSLGWLEEGLNDFKNVERDGRLSRKAADWRVSKRLWCELYGIPHWIVTAPWRVLRALAEIAIVSICVEMVFVVFMVESFHRMSPISPLLNIPAGLVAAAVTPLGLATIVLPPVLARPVAWVATALLRGLTALVGAALTLPGASLRVPSSPFWIWLLYGFAVIGLVYSIRRRRLRLFLGMGISVLSLQTVVALADFSEAPPKDTTMTFIDVGQGDSILVEFPDGKRMLVDGGGVGAGRFLNLRDESTFSIGENVVSPFLWSKGLRKVDILVLTHAHNDHLSGLLDVIENFEIGEVWLGRNPVGAQYRELLSLAMTRQVPFRWVKAGDTFQTPLLSQEGLRSPTASGLTGALGWFPEGTTPTARAETPSQSAPPNLGGESASTHYSATTISILHPPPNWRPRRGDENNDSVVMLLDSGAATALLTGDIERVIPGPGFVDIYKVPHHGSKGAKLKVRSKVRVVSVGANNPFGHPDPSTLPALRTDRLGAITVTLTSQPVVGSALTTPRHWYKLAPLLESH